MKRIIIAFFLFQALLSPASQASQSIFLDYPLGKIRINSCSDFTQIFFQMPPEAGYVVRELTHPPRIMLNLYPANIDSPSKDIIVGDKFVKKIRLARDSENVVKMVIDLAVSEYSFGIFSKKSPHTLMIEIKPPKEDVILAILNKKEDEDKWAKNLSSERQGKIYRIIIDPGHGGEDPGAIGPSGVKEKDVTLSIALKLAKLLRKNLSFVEVFLTRDKDKFVSLDKRAEIANQLKGDLFVSIHANATWDRRVKGIETFYNSRYAYGEGAEEVAMRENTAFASDKLPSEVKNIIWDLIQNQYRTESRQFAQIIQENLVDVCKMLNRGVKSARFYVLRGVNMPAILVEVGFISNPLEERKLKSKEFQEIIALGLYKGLARYINSFNKKVEDEKVNVLF